MRGHAHLRRGKVECYLDGYDERDVSEPLFCEWRVMMSQQNSRRRADHAHDAARGAYELEDVS